MCVVFSCMVKRPTPEMVEKAWARNSHGGGIAWREKDEATGKVLVHWEKNLTLPQMQEACATLPIPFVAHFRVASVGGVLPELCHPFEVSLETSDALSGITENAVLFHNGDWSPWREVMLKGALRKGIKIPDGKWSDSRAMAWLSAMFGKNIMDVIDQKGLSFGPGTGDDKNPWDGIEHFTGSGWKEINEVWCSNDLFWGGVRANGMCKDSHCHERSGLDADGMCSQHRKRFPVYPTISGQAIEDEVDDTKVTALVVRMDDHKKRSAGFRGDQPPAPFPLEVQVLIDGGFKDQAMRVAETMHKNHPDKLGKNCLKRIRLDLTGRTETPFFPESVSTPQSTLVH